MLAYVDTSFLLATAARQRGAGALAARLGRYARRVSSNLLEAEFRSALAHDGNSDDRNLLAWIDWIYPDRPLTAELVRILDVGYLKGADAWHVACALFVKSQGEEVSFLTLDERQKAVARKLGFPT